MYWESWRILELHLPVSSQKGLNTDHADSQIRIHLNLSLQCHIYLNSCCNHFSAWSKKVKPLDSENNKLTWFVISFQRSQQKSCRHNDQNCGSPGWSTLEVDLLLAIICIKSNTIHSEKYIYQIIIPLVNKANIWCHLACSHLPSSIALGQHTNIYIRERERDIENA